MHAVVEAYSKRAGQPLTPSVNNVAGQNTLECYLLHITDTKRNEKWLVDGGALLSIIPPTAHQRLRGPNDVKLKAANGSDINCYGTCQRTITIGTTSFAFEFIIADVQTRILGADFLAKNALAPNHRDAHLINLLDFSTLPAEHARGFISLPVNFVNQIDDPYFQLLDQYPEICTPAFTLKQPEHDVRHHIPTEGPPVQSRARRLDPEKLAVAKAELEKLVDLGVCYRGKSEWSSPLLVTTKPNGGWRVCGDYRRLNNLTKDDRYPVRSIMDFTAELHSKSIFSKIDLMKGYHQIPVAEDDIRKTAVITPFGLFVFPRCPFGLKNAGQDFQRLMDAILGDLPRVYVYIDDILVASESKEQHLADLDAVFKTLSANGLVIQRSKCVLGVSSLEFLGYQVDAQGISPLPDRVEAIRTTTPPTTVKELQRFLGMVGSYRRFIPKAATHLYHLFEALKGKPKTLNWSKDCQISFDATKEALARATLLFHPRPGATLALTTDASDTAVGGVLEQRGPLGWEPLAFYSSKLKSNEKLYPPYDRELLGAFKGIRHFRDMIEGRAFTLYTDHQSLIPSLSKKTDPQTARQTYQLMCISEYTTDIRYVQGKANLVADALSRPNEVVADISAALPHSSGRLELLQQQQQQPATLPTLTELSTTACPDSNSQRILPKNASSTTSSISPNASAAAADEPLRRAGNETATSSITTSLTCTPNMNSVDARAQQAATSTLKREAAASDLHMVVNAIGDMGLDWNEIARQQPLDPEFRRLREDTRCGLNFMSTCIGTQNLIVDISNGPARPYIPFASRKRVFDVFHGLGHPGVERTRQSISAKVVWPSMRQDVTKWARECLQCQQAKVTKHTIPPIGDFAVPNRRFQHLNIDLVTLPVSNGFKYLFTAVDRFSRWPIAVPLVDMTAESVIDAFAYGWVQTYGVPSTITSDNGTQFTSTLFSQLTKIWGIKCLTTTPYHPEANGMVERFHRRLKEGLIALGADSPQDWFWRLPCVLLAIRTTLKPDLGASPADLVFGEQLAVPGEALPANPIEDEQLARQRAAALADVRIEVARLQPVQTSAHRQPLVHIPQELNSCTHIFVRRGGIQASLASPYVGPFRVISHNDFNFTIAVPGRANETVSISRVKPCFSSVEDAEEAEPHLPPYGRPRNPPPPRRNRRHRRPQRTDDDDERLDDPQPSPPHPPPASPPPHWSPPAWYDADGGQDGTDDHLQWPPDPQPASPAAPQQAETDWFSPDPSPQHQPPADPQTPPRPPMPRQELFPDSPPLPHPPPPPPPPSRRRPGNPNWVKGYKRRRPDMDSPPPPPNPPSPPPPDPPSPPRPPPPRRRRPGNPNWVKGYKRRRPDVNSLNAFLRQHLDLQIDIPTSSTSPTSSASPSGLFPPFDIEKSRAFSGTEPETSRPKAHSLP